MSRIPHFHEKSGVSKSGKKWTAYYHVAKVEGKVKWTSLGSNRVQALRKWADIEKSPTPTEAGTCDAIYQAFMEWFKGEVEGGRNKQRTYDDRETYWKTMKSVFSGKPMQAIDSVVVRKYIDKRSAKISAKKEMRFLSVMWNWAKERGFVTGPNPVTGVKLPTEKGRQIAVRPEDYWLVWECGDQVVKNVLELAARLGTRPDELFSLEWKQVDYRSSPISIRVWQSKGDEPRTVIADDELEALIGRLRGDREVPKGFVLTTEKGERLSTTGAFRYRFSLARDLAETKAEKLGIEFERFQHRDIRPMAGISTMQSEGMEAARRLLGHTTEKMTAHYTSKRIGTVGRSAPVRSTSNLSQNITEAGELSD
jgi:integrase